MKGKKVMKGQKPYWQQHELQIIRDNPNLTDAQLAAMLGRSKASTRNQRQRLGLHKFRSHLNLHTWSPEKVVEYIQRWKENTGDQMAVIYGCSRRVIQWVNKSLGLKKDREWRSMIHRHPYKVPAEVIERRKATEARKAALIEHRAQLRRERKEAKEEARKARRIEAEKRRQQKREEKRVQKVPKVKKPKKERPKKIKVVKVDHTSREWQRQAKRNRQKERVLPSKPVDLSGKVAVRIDHKTVIYVNKGVDIESVILKYKKTG